MNKKFEGSMVALVTPMKEGKIDEPTLRKLIDRQIEAGTHGLIPCGTTGESATLTHQEHDRVIQITVEQTAGRALVLAGAGSNATHEAVRLNQSAQKAGADGTLHITPYYNKPTQEGLYQHFKAVSQSSSLPIVLYNVPSRTGVNLLPETVERLCGFKNIVGLKEASGSLDQVKKIMTSVPAGFSLLSGEDAQTLDMLKLGARGAISVTANVVPQLCAEEWEAFLKGDEKNAARIHEKLMPLHNVMFIETNPIPVKAALAMLGLITEEYRLPLVPLSAQNRSKLENVLRQEGLL